MDDMEDDVTMTALRLLVKDLLMLFQAVNEGVINVLGKDQPDLQLVDFANYSTQSTTLRCRNQMLQRRSRYISVSVRKRKKSLLI